MLVIMGVMKLGMSYNLLVYSVISGFISWPRVFYFAVESAQALFWGISSPWR